MMKKIFLIILGLLIQNVHASLECEVIQGGSAGLYIDKELTKLGKLYQVAIPGKPFTYFQVAKNVPDNINGKSVMFGNGFLSSNYKQPGQVSIETYVASYFIDASQWQCQKIKNEEMLDKNLKEQARMYSLGNSSLEQPTQKKQTVNKDSESDYSKRVKEDDRRQCLKFVESRKTCAVAANYGRCMDITFGSNMWYVYKDICSY
jgi:hypothetical protein